MKSLAQTLIVAAALVASAGAQHLVQSPVGIFESHGKIGMTPIEGSVEYNPATSEYRVAGDGANIWGSEDALQFAWKRVSGDVRLTADVHFLGAGAVAHRKAVLMVRQDLTPCSAYADAALHGDGLTSLQFRPTQGSETQEIRASVNAPVRIRIDRRGNRFTIYAGKAGEELQASGPETVNLTDPVYIGIGVCSHDAGVLETAVFSNVQIEQLPPAGESTR